MPGPAGSSKTTQTRGRGRRGFKRAGALVETQIRKVSETRGFAVSRLLTHWPEIVGTDLARLCRPLRAAYGRGSFGATLTVLVTGAAAPIVQARLPELRERVNACYGYTAISRIKITQTAPDGFADPPTAFAHAPKTRTVRAPVTCDALDTVRDPDLRAALETLSARLPDPTSD